MNFEVKTIAELERRLYDFVLPAAVSRDEPIPIARTEKLAHAVCNPQKTLRVIHVAGTSGKGSTCYAIASRLLAAGAKVGMTISPHIFSITERVQIDGAPLADEKFIAYFNEFFALVQSGKNRPTYFEFMMVFALWVFAREQVDYAIVETGLGGTHDSSNICRQPNKICVLTEIGLDHTEILGETLADIAAQKAGIIAPENMVIARRQASDVNEVFEKIAAEQRAKITWAEENTGDDFVARNQQMANEVYFVVAGRDGLPPLEQLRITELAAPGRMSEFTLANGNKVIVDGAHNPQKVAALLRALAQNGEVAFRIIIAMKQSKDIAAAIDLLAPHAEQVIATGFSGAQDTLLHAIPPAKPAALFQQQNIQTTTAPSCTAALEQLAKEPGAPILVVGSLYICGEALGWLSGQIMIQ